MLCGNFLNLDSLFQCFYSRNKEKDTPIGKFSLVIDKRIGTYQYALSQDNTRVSLVDNKINYLNTPNINTNVLLPAIFITKQIKGRSLQDVIHPDVAPFYKNLILSTFQERSIVKLHIVLNNIHILLTTYPILDNKKKIIGCTLLETPFLDIADSTSLRQSYESGSFESEIGELRT
jgi:hypothetical protein